MNSASDFNPYHSSLNLGKELKRMIVTWTRIGMCSKKAKNMKKEKQFDKAKHNISFLPQFDQLHFFKCIAMMVDQYIDCTEG